MLQQQRSGRALAVLAGGPSVCASSWGCYICTYQHVAANHRQLQVAQAPRRATFPPFHLPLFQGRSNGGEHIVLCRSAGVTMKDPPWCIPSHLLPVYQRQRSLAAASRRGASRRLAAHPAKAAYVHDAHQKGAVSSHTCWAPSTTHPHRAATAGSPQLEILTCYVVEPTPQSCPRLLEIIDTCSCSAGTQEPNVRKQLVRSVPSHRVGLRWGSWPQRSLLGLTKLCAAVVCFRAPNRDDVVWVVKEVAYAGVVFS